MMAMLEDARAGFVSYINGRSAAAVVPVAVGTRLRNQTALPDQVRSEIEVAVGRADVEITAALTRLDDHLCGCRP